MKQCSMKQASGQYESVQWDISSIWNNSALHCTVVLSAGQSQTCVTLESTTPALPPIWHLNKSNQYEVSIIKLILLSMNNNVFIDSFTPRAARNEYRMWFYLLACLLACSFTCFTCSSFTCLIYMLYSFTPSAARNEYKMWFYMLACFTWMWLYILYIFPLYMLACFTCLFALHVGANECMKPEWASTIRCWSSDFNFL